MKMREELLALIEKSDYKGMNVEQLSHTLHKDCLLYTSLRN